jgi:probable rRNA maturation factor
MSTLIDVSDTQAHINVDPAEVVRLVREVLLAENHPAACISIAVVDNATIHRLNRNHLCHDWPTDVITFPLSGPGETACSGEVVVSAEMAVSSARELNGEPLSELGLYLIHGLLHLCGYDDKSEADAAAMAARQAELLESIAPWRHAI